MRQLNKRLFTACFLMVVLLVGITLYKKENKMADFTPGALYIKPDNTLGVNPGNSQGVLGDSTYYDTSTGQVTGPNLPDPPTDPYAQYGGESNYNNLVNQFNTGKQNVYTGSSEAAQAGGQNYGSSILNFLDSLRSGQKAIDTRSINNELAKQQGYQGVQGMVSRGIRSGGTLLANRNASNSSAAQAIARAYGELGRGQLSNIGNQYALENRNIGQAQEDFNTQQQAGVRGLNLSHDQLINDIVFKARDAFARLNDQAASASIPDRVNIEQEKEAIRQQALQQLSQYDQQLSSGVAGVRPTDQTQNRSSANDLASAGQAAANPFNFTNEAPAQFQGTGPSGFSLPIFTSPRSRRTA